jgi:hypothetical protein
MYRWTLALAGALVALPFADAAAKLPEGKVATAATWGTDVGFAPDLSNPAFKPGMVIDASGAAAFEAWLPEGLRDLVTGFGLTLPTAAYVPIHPSIGYIDATNRNQGGVATVDPGKSIRTKGISGYVAGLPFPDPVDGFEVAWNAQLAHVGDDGELHFGVWWLDRDKGLEREEEWRWRYIARAMHRTDLEPMPAIPWFERRSIQYASLAWGVDPYDKAGATALYYRHDDPRDQQGFLYVPTMRRALRLTFGAPGIPWNQTDLLWEDVRGYSGHPEWMTWTLVGRATVLAPMHADVAIGKDAARRTFDLEAAPHWNPRMTWEPRPVYVVEAKPKFWTCPYERVLFYVDAETFYIPLKVGYDKKGRLWKVVVNAWNESPDPDRLPPPLALSLAVDLLSGHATAFPSYGVKANLGLDRAEFTEANLRRITH